MNRKFLVILFSGLLMVAISCKQQEKPKDLPNIVIIMADDMGYGDLSSYNPNSKIQTPNMDKLATEGIRFTDAHSPDAVCTPSRYGLLTGRYCWRTRLKKGVILGYDEAPLIESQRMTLASLLKLSGYRTGAFGKWHLGMNWQTKDGLQIQNDSNKWKPYTGIYRQNEEAVDFSKPILGGPTDLGFDVFYGTQGCSTGDPPYCFIEGDRTVGIPTKVNAESYDSLPGFAKGYMIEGWSQEDVDPIFTSKAISFIEEGRNSDDPFFLYLALSSPHIPFLPPDFAKGSSEEGPRGDLVKVVDWSVGKIMDTLDQLGMAENTLLIVTSDNGPRRGANGHASAGEFRGYKANIWEGGHRVPFIVRWPGKSKPNSIHSSTISLTDMFATFAAITSKEIPSDIAEDSYNVLPSFLNKTLNSENARVFHSVAGIFALRKGDYKLILGTKGSGSGRVEDYSKDTGQLYNLAEDPGEENDLWDEEPERVAEMVKMLGEIQKDQVVK